LLTLLHFVVEKVDAWLPLYQQPHICRFQVKCLFLRDGHHRKNMSLLN
jgi:hypothetical protein